MPHFDTTFQAARARARQGGALLYLSVRLDLMNSSLTDREMRLYFRTRATATPNPLFNHLFNFERTYQRVFPSLAFLSVSDRTPSSTMFGLRTFNDEYAFRRLLYSTAKNIPTLNILLIGE